MRTVVVTGAATGIGRAIAARFHRHGDRVVLTGRRVDALTTTATELGDDAHPVAFDATEPEQITAALVHLPARIDVLVNNAGGNTDFDRDEPTDLADLADLAAAWRANLDANLTSAVLVTNALRDRLTPGAAIINIGSIAADKGAGAYGAAKAGLASWTVDLAAQLGPDGITANTLAPGYVADTEFFRDRLDDTARQAMADAAPTRRASTPDDIAASTYFLASPDARQITGQVLHVNGGEHRTR